jgi:septal ring factor EnvC (AmiA/AmiB activator)
MSRKRKIKFIFLLGITIALVFAVFRTQAEDSISDLSKEEKKELEETQNKIKELEDKAKTYEQIIDMKRKQQQTLADQISLIEAEAQKIEAEININKEKIEELNKKISELFNQIESQEDISRAQKQLLSNRVFYF